MSEFVPVPFAGDGAGEAELSWGQREIWQAMVHQGSWFPLGGVRVLPPDTTVADLVARLRFILSRFPSARTRLRFADDGPRQVVDAAGETVLEIVDTAPAESDPSAVDPTATEPAAPEPASADPALVAEQVRLRFCATDFTDRWPVRMAAIRHEGRLTHVVTIFSHLVTDGFGWPTLAADVKSYELERGAALPPVTAAQPLDQARWQRSLAGQRTHAAAMRYWARLLRSLPAQRFGWSTDLGEPRYRHARLDSPAGYLGMRAIAARTRVDFAMVLLALALVALGRLTGINPVAIRPIVSNRFRPGLAGSVSPINQAGLCLVDVAGGTVDDVVVRSWRSALAAYRHAYFDPTGLGELVARVAAERGEVLDLACYLNDRRVGTRRQPAGPVPTRQEIARALPLRRFGWLDGGSRERFFLTVEDVPDTLALSLSADTQYVPPAGIEAFLRDVEMLAVAAAGDPDLSTGVPTVAAGGAVAPVR